MVSLLSFPLLFLPFPPPRIEIEYLQNEALVSFSRPLYSLLFYLSPPLLTPFRIEILMMELVGGAGQHLLRFLSLSLFLSLRAEIVVFRNNCSS